MVDVGGNWLRVYRAGAAEEDGQDRRSGLDRVVEVAVRQGGARGDDAADLAVLDRGLARHADAPAGERARAGFYRTELLTRLDRGAEALATLAAVEAELTRQPQVSSR